MRPYVQGATFSIHSQLYRGHINAIDLLLFSRCLSITCAQHLYIAEETLGSRLIYIFLLHKLMLGKLFNSLHNFLSCFWKFLTSCCKLFYGDPQKLPIDLKI